MHAPPHVVLALRLALRWYRERVPRDLALAVFLAGLGTGNHTFMGLAAIAIAIFAPSVDRSLFRKPKLVAVCGRAFFAGLLVYLYLPIRSRFEPVLDWGNPETPQALLDVVLRSDFWMRRCREAWKQYQAHPQGPHTYGGWDAVPEAPETRPTHARWLRQYLPIVEDGTWAWLEVRDSDLFAVPLPNDTVASAFANRELYLVLANFGRAAAEIATADSYPSSDRPARRAVVDVPRRTSVL